MVDKPRVVPGRFTIGMTPLPLAHAAGEDTRIRAALDASHALAPLGHAIVFDQETLLLQRGENPQLGALPWPRFALDADSVALTDLFADDAHEDLLAAIARAQVTSMTRAALLERSGSAVIVTITTFGSKTPYAVAIIDASSIETGLADDDDHVRTRIVCDRHGNVITVDGSLGSWVHLGASVGRWSERIVAAADRPILHRAVAQVLGGEPYARTKVAGAAPGLQFQAVVAPFGESLVIDFYDESHERQAISALGRLQTQFNQLSETLPVGVFVIGEDSRLEFHSRRLREIFGPAVSSEYGWIDIVHPDDRHLLQAALAALPTRGTFNTEARCERADGSIGLFRIAGSDMRDDKGELTRIVGFAEDISEQRDLYRRIEFQASFDDLTELPNRTAVLDQLRAALEEEGGDGTTGVLFIDLDGFKLINDTQGHSVGDIVLVEVAHRFRRAVRARDVIGRLGGDEFVVVAPNLSGPDEAELLAQRLHDILSTPVLADGRIISVGASIGIAISEGASTSEQLVGDADIAMYEAKGNGQSRTVLFDAPLRSRASRRFDMTADLRHARRRRELRLEYQPIIDLQTNRLVGAEGLVRWDHPAMGRISPDVFVPLAEEIGLIADIGEWVVEQACADIDRLRARELVDDQFAVSVNASAHQFNNVAMLATSCLAALDQYGLSPRNLRFELTESVPLTQIPDAATRIRQLTSYGFGLAIDDFGTGYSSLGYLTMLPFDVLKLDLSLIAQIQAGSAAMAVVDSLTRMSHEMGFTIVAEGIEHATQQQLLRGAGVQLGQGYHISRPLTLSRLADLLERHLLQL